MRADQLHTHRGRGCVADIPHRHGDGGLHSVAFGGLRETQSPLEGVGQCLVVCGLLHLLTSSPPPCIPRQTEVPDTLLYLSPISLLTFVFSPHLAHKIALSLYLAQNLSFTQSHSCLFTPTFCLQMHIFYYKFKYLIETPLFPSSLQTVHAPDECSETGR